MHRRRAWTAAFLLAGAALVAPLAGAQQVVPLPASARCAPDASNGQHQCAVGWTQAHLYNLWQPQELTNWCWAAAISMLFSASGLVMSQPGIVERHYGELLDEPEHLQDILDLLNRAWSDAQGRRFRFVTEIAGRGVDLRSLAGPLLADMDLGRPWLIFHARHVVLLPRVEVETDARRRAARIVGGTVLDPDPGQGVRPLRADEWVPRYAVRVRVVADD